MRLLIEDIRLQDDRVVVRTILPVDDEGSEDELCAPALGLRPYSLPERLVRGSILQGISKRKLSLGKRFTPPKSGLSFG